MSIEITEKNVPLGYEKILAQAKEAILAHRKGNDLENSFAEIAAHWSLYLGKRIRAQDVAIMMILFKTVRQRSGINLDNNENLIDICGYAALAAGVE